MNYKRSIIFLLSLIPLIFLLSGNGLGQEIKWPWFSPLNIHFHLRVDPLSLIFLYLTAVMIPISLFVERRRGVLILILQWLLIAFFTARDLVLFTFFWEAMLIPLYFLIERKSVAIKFLIYMIAGSVLMVLGLLAIYFQAGTFDLDVLKGGYPLWIALTFFLAFAVKTPLFPFHGWLPDVYTGSPTSSTILLSALLSKAGLYGFMRIGWGVFPDSLAQMTPYLIALAVAGVLYASLVAWRQLDYKRLMAYSSLAHVNFILAGVFVWNLWAREGAILQSVNHSITIAALFLVAFYLEKRIGTTTLGSFGLAPQVPRLCWLTLFFVLSSVALPGLNNFVGEVLILLGVFQYDLRITALLALSVILSVMYMLRFMQKVYFGPPGTLKAYDIGWKEGFQMAPLVILVIWIGLYPAYILKLIGMIK